VPATVRACSLPPFAGSVPGSGEHCVKAPPTSGRPASGNLPDKRPAPGSLSDQPLGQPLDQPWISPWHPHIPREGRIMPGLPPYRAPPHSMRLPLLPRHPIMTATSPPRPLYREHDGIVRFRYMSGGPVLSQLSHQLPVVLSCSFKHRWLEVLAAARIEAGLPLILSSPLARDTDHVLASAKRTRVAWASIVAAPPQFRQ
jgi:hypothetical protein